MNARIARLSVGLVLATGIAAAAHAEYRGDPAPTPVDQRTCEAAKQGPDALRRFIERWDSKRSNLYFADYVDAATAQTWDAKSAQAAGKPAIEEDRTSVEMTPERIGA